MGVDGTGGGGGGGGGLDSKGGVGTDDDSGGPAVGDSPGRGRVNDFCCPIGGGVGVNRDFDPLVGVDGTGGGGGGGGGGVPAIFWFSGTGAC